MNTSHDSGSAVQREYSRLASAYDERWADYIEAGVRRMLPRLPAGQQLRLLDVGCGTGVLLDAVGAERPGWTLVGVDVSAEMLRQAQHRLRDRAWLVRAAVGHLPLRPRSVDVVVSSSSLHYWPDAGLGVREIARALRPGGRVVLVDWSADSPSTRLLSLALRLLRRPMGRVFRSRELAALLAASGFERVEAQPFRAGAWGMMTVTATRAPNGGG